MYDIACEIIATLSKIKLEKKVINGMDYQSEIKCIEANLICVICCVPDGCEDQPCWSGVRLPTHSSLLFLPTLAVVGPTLVPWRHREHYASK